MQLIEDKYFGQIFITDTDKQRVLNAIETTKSFYIKFMKFLKL